MDKEPSMIFLWGFFLVLGMIGFAVVRIFPPLLPLFLLVSVAYWCLMIGEINDRFVGPSILSELGISYVISVYVAGFIGTVLPILGVPAWFLRRRKRWKSLAFPQIDGRNPEE